MKSFDRARQAVAVALFTGAITACGGGGGGSTPAGVFVPTPSPSPTLAATANGSLTTSTTQTQSMSFGPIAGGYSGAITVPPVNLATTISATFGSGLPPGAPALAAMQRRPQTIGRGGPFTALAYLTLTAPADLSFPHVPVFSLTLPGVTPALASSAYLAEYDSALPVGGWYVVSGPATVSGGALSFDGTPFPGSATFSLHANAPLMLAVIASGGPFSIPTSTPTPSPTPSPAPSATPALAAAPTVGYLAQTSTGSLAGKLTAIVSGGTAVAISTAELDDSSSTVLANGNLVFSLGNVVLDRARSIAAVRSAAAGPHLDIDGPTEGPREIAALQSHLRRTSSAGRGGLAYRRTRTLGTALGSAASFWVSVFAIGSASVTDVQIPATLKAVTPNGYVWIDNTLLGTLADADITKIGADFENAYASDTTHYGPAGFTAASPGVANAPSYTACDSTGASLGSTVAQYVVPPDGKINAFVINTAALGSGVGGYFSAVNYYYQSALNCGIGRGYSAATVPHSNEAPMIYVGWNTHNSAGFETGEDLVRGTAHELQHLINFVNHSALNNGTSENAWINEGMSMLAQDLAVKRMYGIPHDAADALFRAQLFTNAPQNFSLTAFSGIDAGKAAPAYNCSGCYGIEYLFQRYLYDRFGGDAYLRAMLGGTTNYAALAQATGVSPQVLISDFALALAASGSGATADPRFGIPSLNLQTPYTDQFGRTTTVGNPATVALPSSAAPYVGTFAYYGLGPGALNQSLSAKDVGGGFGLQLGVVQR